MESTLLLSLLTLTMLYLTVSPWRFYIEPSEGSIAGGTWIKIILDGLHHKELVSLIAASTSCLEVYLFKSSSLRIPCDLHPVFSDAFTLKCKTRSSQEEGTYWLQIIFNGRPMNHFGTLYDNNFTFKYTAAKTPLIYQVNPPLGVPGNVLTIFGWILTEKYETYDFNIEYIDGPAELKTEGDDWMSICSFADKQTNTIYPIQSDHGYGTLQCCVEGHFIGSHNVSFSVFNIGKAAVTKDAWLISAKQELFLYQTHPDILSVVPVNGSLGGGTNITITGDFFHHPSNVTIAGVPCETKIVSPTMIVCTTGPVKHHRLKSPQPGNRGLLFEVWNGTSKTNVTESSLGYRWGMASNASSLLHLLPRGPEPFSSVLSGFFVVPETNNYTFWIQADDKAALYFCHSEDLGKKVRIASIPAGISSWSDHWEKNWNESWQQKSEKFVLIGGKKYYMEAWHYGKMPSKGMKVGVQIHNTWLNPTVVNTYHREKLEIEVRAVRLPEIQMLTLTGAGRASLSWENVSSCLIPSNATAQQIEDAIEEILAIKCGPSSLSAAVLLRANFEQGVDAAGTEGQLAAWPEPYCGRFSSLKPRHLIKMRQSSTPRYDLTKYTHVCFAYKGYIKNAVNVSISYTNVMLNMVKKNLICLWNHDESNPESWTFGCTNLWINCVNSSGFPKDLRVNSKVWVHQIDLSPLQMEDESLDWFYVDEIIVSESNHTVFQTDLKPARPGGSVIESVSVTGLWPTFNLSFWVANCVVDIPLMSLSGVLTSAGSSQDGHHAEYAEYKNVHVKMTIRRLQSASPPLGGHFKIQLSDTILTGVSADISSSNLKRLLQSNADNFMAQYINASDFTVIKTVSTCYHSTWTMTWTSTVGDLHYVIKVFNENLTGLYPTVTSRVIYDGGVFLAPIFGDMLATANELPQVSVHVNDIPATCSGSCSFHYLQDLTPTVTDIKYSSDDGIRMTVYVTGSGFTNDSQAVSVQINQTVCKILQANSTSIICSTSTLPPRGTYPVTVQVTPYGSAVNSSRENVCLIVEPRIFTINPSTGSETGGTWITMEGMSLEKVQVVLFGSHPALVDFETNNTMKIVCRLPPKVAEDYVVDVTVIIGNQSLRLTDAFKYDPSLNPVVVSLSRNTSSTAGGEKLVIELLRFDGHEDQDTKVTIGNTPANIKRRTPNGIEAILPPMPIGLYSISITINGVQVNSTDELLAVEYVGNITSIEPCCGSFKGGTTLTITGVGFSCNSSVVTVLLNSDTCDVICSSEEVIQCQTRQVALPRGSDTMAVLIRVFIGNVHSCHLGYPTHKFYFTYTKEFTPVVSSISWTFVSDTVLFYILGSNMINSSLLLEGSSCELQPLGANQTLYFCSLLLDSLEAGSYKISVMHKEYGYADISSAMNIFSLPPLVFSVAPSNGSACGGLTLTISGQFLTSSSNFIKVNLTNNFTCTIQDFNDNTIRCNLQVNQTLCFISDCQHLNITVIVNGITSVCQGNCSSSICEESTPVVDHMTHRTNGNITTLFIRGHRLAEVIDELNILVDNMICNSTFGNQTLVVCHVKHLYPGMHHISVTNKRFGQACFITRSMEFMIVPQVKEFFPKSVSLNGGALLTLTGLALQGQNSTTVFIGNESICSISHLSYVTIQCTAPPRNMNSALSLEIDGVFYYVGEVNYHQNFTPVFLFALPSTSRLLRIITSRIAEAEKMHVFVGDWICANVSVNSSTLQCLVPYLPAGDYQVKGYDPTRGWASSNVTYTWHLSVSSVLNNYGCLGQGVLHLQGTGFSPGYTSVTVCGSHCEIQDSLTPTDVQCVTQHPSDFLGFLCSFTEDVTDSCKGPQNTYIHCDVTVAAGTSSLTKEFSYVHACHGLPCTASFNMTLDAPSSITGLFLSPKVERDEVLIYNSSCTITMATEAEMECERPNQPITTKITEIRKNWGQNTKVNISLNVCGRWSENSSWSCGHPPQDGDNVTVERGQTLLLDTSTKVLNLLHVKGGKLLFLGPGPVSLHAHYILVSDGGELRVGSHDEPFTGKAQIHLYGSGYSRAFFPYGVKFLAVRNATLSIHGWQPETPFTHLKSPAPANSRRLELQKKVDWRPGDEIVISGPGQDLGDDSRLDEVVTIETVNSAEVVFRPPLRYHHGFVEQMVSGQRVVLKPLVAVLTRDIVLRGNLTREWISYVQQCAAVGITDVSECIHGKSERRLGSRDLGAVVIVQTFQGEASVVRLEGLQLQDVGQAFRPPPAALTIAGNGHMTDSYIRGCSILHSFGRGISLSSTSNLKVENNILYNISGHGLLLEEGVEYGNRIWRNAVIGIFATDALSNIEILTPAGILIRAPTNTVEENIVYGAGIGFFFHLSQEGPSQASLQSFSRNTATYCTRSALKVYPEYCPKSTRETAMAVFQSFTAWRCRGGIEIHRSSNLQLQHFQIFSCTDFGIDITESLGNTSLVDSLLLGRFTGKGDSCMVAGLKTPKRFQLLVSNTTFVNFVKPSCTAIRTCSDCYQGQGGFRVEVMQLKFINSPNQALFPFPHSAILEDVDGSVSGKEGSHLLASMDMLPASCLKYTIGGTSIGSICGKDVILHRMSVGLMMAPDREYYLSVTDSNNKTTTVNYVLDTLSNMFGWMALLVDTETYTLAFDDPSTRNHLQYSATFDNFAAGNYLLVQHGDLPSHVDVMITCGGRPGQSLQFPPSPSNNKGCDWFFDRRIRTLTYLVSGESDIRVTFNTEKRVLLPPTGPSLSPNVVLMWSIPESWEGVEPGWGGSNYSVPSAGDDVIILPNRTIFVDIDLPPLRGLYILGTLEFPVNSSNVLSAGCIVVAGGELNIGTSEHPLEREHKVSIILRASEGIFCHRLDGINVDPGTIGVFGKLQIHSAYPKMAWTRLGADIAPGNDRILLEDAVDWTPGEDIVISSSTYDAHQAELGILKEVSKKSIKIHKPVLHRHTGRSYMVENRNLSSAAEVGILARNVKIESDEPCSGRIYVGQLKRINGTYFTGVLRLSNVEIANFGTLQHSSIELNGAAPGSYMMFSSVHSSCSGGISAVASSNISLHGNIVFNTTGHGINLEGQNHNISRNLIVLTQQPENVEEWIAGIKINLADEIALFGNTVAGSERIAFWVSGQICDQFQSPWNENVAHSSLHGVHLYDGDGFPNCTRIVGFTSHKNYDYGIMFHVESSVLVENVTLIDNNIGLLPIVHRQKDLNKFEKKYIVLRHCMIVATSPAFDCLKDRIRPYNVISTSRDRSPFNPLRGRVGIIWPIFTSKAGQWPKDSWHKIISNSSVYGITKFQDVTFSGFVKSCYSDDNDVCIMSNPESAQVMFPIIAERTTMSQIKDVNKFFFHTSQPWSGDVCVDACDRRRALFKDVDGSTLPLTSSVTVSQISEHAWPHSCFNTSKLNTVSITDELDSP